MSRTLWALAQGHVDTEAYLQDSGLAYTILRDGPYAQLLPTFLGASLSTRELALPADGPAAWVSRANLAEAAARLLAETSHENETLRLTGSEALDIAQVADIAGRIVGRPITRRVIDSHTYGLGLIAARGMPEKAAQSGASMFSAMAVGEYVAIDPTLGKILARISVLTTQ